MRLRNMSWKLSLLLVALVACGDTAADTDASSSTPTAGTSTAAESGSAQRSDALTFVELHADYRLTMPEVRRWFDAQKNIYRSMAASPDLADRIDMSNVQASTPDDVEAHFDGIPEVRDAVEGVGLDMRAYTSILIALTHAIAMDAVIQGGHADRAAVIAEGQVSPGNLELVEQNRAEIQRLEDELDGIGM